MTFILGGRADQAAPALVASPEPRLDHAQLRMGRLDLCQRP